VVSLTEILGFKEGFHYYITVFLSSHYPRMVRVVKLAIDTGSTYTTLIAGNIRMPPSVFNRLEPDIPVLAFGGNVIPKIMEHVTFIFIDRKGKPYPIHVEKVHVINRMVVEECDGVLGMDVISRFKKTTINEQNQTIIFEA